MRMKRIVPSLIAVALVAGCESNPTSPEVNVDAVLSQMSTSGISGFTAVAATASGSGVVAPSVNAPSSTASCPYNTATSFFVCAPVTNNGVTVSRSFQLRDATGAPLSTPNPLLLASVRSIIDVSGTITPANGSQVTTEITRHEDATLTGIMSTNRVLNANSTQRLAFTGSSFSFVSNDTSATTDLQLPATAAQKYPLGGTITTSRTYTSSGITTSTYKQHEEITFDGTSVMTIKITGGVTATFTTTCKINLATPGVAPVCT